MSWWRWTHLVVEGQCERNEFLVIARNLPIPCYSYLWIMYQRPLERSCHTGNYQDNYPTGLREQTCHSVCRENKLLFILPHESHSPLFLAWFCSRSPWRIFTSVHRFASLALCYPSLYKWCVQNSYLYIPSLQPIKGAPISTSLPYPHSYPQLLLYPYLSPYLLQLCPSLFPSYFYHIHLLWKLIYI